MSQPQESPGLAAVLSFILPGAGQIYAGRWGWGIFWLIFTPGFWIGTGGCLGFVCHIGASYQAHSMVEQRNRG
jgi:TM2 domain-containing membrane protein YozV